MRKRIDRMLNLLIGSTLGVFIGKSTYDFWDYKSHPMIYEIQSAPWYTAILLYGAVCAFILLVAVIAKFTLKRKQKHQCCDE